MRNPEKVLNTLCLHSKVSDYKYERLYRILFNEDMFYVAYQRIYAKQGNMTSGADGKTIDQMSIQRIEHIIESLKNETYQPKPCLLYTSVTEPLHVFPADFRQLAVGQHVVGMRIEGDVYDRLFGAVMVRHPFEKLPHGFIRTEAPVFGIAEEMCRKDFCPAFIDLVLIVDQCAVQVLTHADPGYHVRRVFGKVRQSGGSAPRVQG